MSPMSALLVLLFHPADALAAGTCPFLSATVEECPAMFYPVPKPPGPTDADLAPLLKEAQAAVLEERAAMKAWLDARTLMQQTKDDLDSAFYETDKLRKNFATAASDYRTAASALNRRKVATDFALKHLVDAAGQSYGASPPRTDFRGENIARNLATWSPTFNRCEVTDATTGKCRLRDSREHDLHDKEAALAAAAQGLPPPQSYATTNPVTGQIVVNSASFDRPEPEEFAATVIHESVHWVDITSVGGYARLPNNDVGISPAEKFDRERLAYLEEAKFFRALKMEGKARAAEATAEVFKVQRVITLEHGLSWTDIRTTPQYRSWRGVQDHFQSDGRQELDFNHETLTDIQQGTHSLDERLRQEGSRRLQEARRATGTEEARREIHQWMLAEAARCGLEPVDSWNVRYRVIGRAPEEAVHMEWGSKETFKAGLLLAAACHSPDDESPCNDAMDIITSRWRDDAFRKTMEMLDDAHEDTRFCVAHIARRLGNPNDFRTIQREAKSYRKWLVERRRQPASDPRPNPDTGGSTTPPRRPRDADGGTPPRQDVPWCLQAPGRRCIH